MTLVVDEGERLTEDELIGTCVLLLNAGHEATVNVTGNGWWALFRNPGTLDLLRADPELVPTAVEELMRWDTPLQLFERWVLEDVEIHGVRVPRGAELGLVFGSANRDPSVFDHPDELRLDPRPEPAPHLRRRHTLLPWGAARPPRAADFVRDRATPPAEPRARRRAPLEAGLHHQRSGVTAREGVSPASLDRGFQKMTRDHEFALQSQIFAIG